MIPSLRSGCKSFKVSETASLRTVRRAFLRRRDFPLSTPPFLLFSLASLLLRFDAGIRFCSFAIYTLTTSLDIGIRKPAQNERVHCEIVVYFFPYLRRARSARLPMIKP
ncbi:hypothetical protein HMPREF1147_1321 [Selenomonas sp. FOBRC9]|nr:hypothetical protein HMPREF1147_1321 [Selenomonas sp. FOBRC9]